MACRILTTFFSCLLLDIKVPAVFTVLPAFKTSRKKKILPADESCHGLSDRLQLPQDWHQDYLSTRRKKNLPFSYGTSVPSNFSAGANIFAGYFLYVL